VNADSGIVSVQVSGADAASFIREHHYSKTAVPGVARYGWVVDGVLVGATIYDNGNHAMRCGLFGPEYYTHVLHHHRLALVPGLPKCTASQFMGAAMRRLHQDRPECWAVVTYADSCLGHHGTIYQATNATYTGIVARGNLKFLDQDGAIQTTQSLSRFGAWPERRAEAARRGWTEIRCKGKHRYVHLLGTARERRKYPPLLWPTLPYPGSQVRTEEEED
jgi:hypothetical protein